MKDYRSTKIERKRKKVILSDFSKYLELNGHNRLYHSEIQHFLTSAAFMDKRIDLIRNLETNNGLLT